MSSIFFDWHDFEQSVVEKYQLQLPEGATFVTEPFSIDKALGQENVSIFVDSKISNVELDQLQQSGCQRILLRSAGFNMLDVEYAKSLGLKVFRVASYSPESIAEHVFALLLSIVRNLNVERDKHEKGINKRTIDSMGYTLQGKTMGIYGIGKIGSAVFRIAQGFGMKLLFFDKYVDEYEGATKLNSLKELFEQSDVVSIHVPLTDETRYSVNDEVFGCIKRKLVLVNTSRGDVVEPEAVISALDTGKLFGLGVDVWDSGDIDDKFDSRLLRDNVMQTQHIAFFTEEAVQSILEQTLASLADQAAEQNVL